jgi:entericidin B
MHANIPIALAVILMIGAAPLLGACNTTAGAGKDLSATGRAVTDTAEKAKPR